jgi:hypothetical protein
MKRIALFLVFTACVSIPHLTPSQLSWAATKWPDARAGELEHGRSLYVTRCGSCHTAPTPAEVKAENDADMVKEMADRAKLTPSEQQAVLRFIEAVTEPAPAGVAARSTEKTQVF